MGQKCEISSQMSKTKPIRQKSLRKQPQIHFSFFSGTNPEGLVSDF